MGWDGLCVQLTHFATLLGGHVGDFDDVGAGSYEQVAWVEGLVTKLHSQAIPFTAPKPPPNRPQEKSTLTPRHRHNIQKCHNIATPHHDKALRTRLPPLTLLLPGHRSRQTLRRALPPPQPRLSRGLRIRIRSSNRAERTCLGRVVRVGGLHSDVMLGSCFLSLFTETCDRVCRNAMLNALFGFCMWWCCAASGGRLISSTKTASVGAAMASRGQQRTRSSAGATMAGAPECCDRRERGRGRAVKCTRLYATYDVRVLRLHVQARSSLNARHTPSQQGSGRSLETSIAPCGVER